MSLKNKVAYITGGSKGIGRGIAEAFIEEGMRVAISARDEAYAQKVVIDLRQKYPQGEIIAFRSNVREHGDEVAAVNQILAHWGQIDVVIANAGVGHFADIRDMTEKQWHDTIDINLSGVFNTTKATIESLIQSKGYLITIASLAGTNFFAKGAAYNASKFGLVGFTQAVMLDLRQHDVKVTTIMPGSVSTHFNGNQPSAEDAWKIQPEDIGQLTVDLLKIDARALPSKIEIRPSKTKS